MPSQNEKAFLDLNRSMAGITDFADLPLVLDDTIKRLMPIDRLGFYTASHQCATYNITTNPHLTFNWDELYQEIAPYGTYREQTLAPGVGQSLILEEVKNSNSEIERHCLEFVRHHTDTVHMLAMPVVKDEQGLAIIGCLRSDPKLGYTNRQIAMAMGITVDGVKKHLKNLSRKLDAQGRAEILYRALWLKKNGIPQTDGM